MAAIKFLQNHKASESFTNDSELKLWKDIQSGNKVAFSHLYENYFDHLFSYGKKINYDVGLIEDCIQDVFVDMWKYKSNINIKNSLKFYLFRSLKNKMLHGLKRQGKIQYCDENEQEYLLVDRSLSVQEQLIAAQSEAQTNKMLECYVASLTKRQKEAVYLKFYQELTYDEISEIMGVSVNAAYNIISKAIANLRSKFTIVSFFLISFFC
jgi:RNA polymerase sigma factor (sigma-70 family)